MVVSPMVAVGVNCSSCFCAGCTMFGFAWYFEKSVEWVALLIVCTVGFSSPTDGAADEHVIALLDFECCRIYKRLFASLD